MPKIQNSSETTTDPRPVIGVSLGLLPWGEVFGQDCSIKPDPAPIPATPRDLRGRFLKAHTRPDARRRTRDNTAPVPFDPSEKQETAFLEKFTGGPYPEHIAQSDNTRPDAIVTRPLYGCEATVTAGFSPPEQSVNPAADYRRAVELPQYLPRCATLAITGGCGNGHRHLKAVVCGREWCPDCGKPNSMAHRRRISRWWKKVHGMPSVGYLVISLPIDLAGTYYNNQDKLNEFRKYIRRKLKRTNISGQTQMKITPYCYRTKQGKIRSGVRRQFIGYNRGLIRWHWAGDCPECEGKGCQTCEFTGAGATWHPHLNILVPDGKLPKPVLSKFRKEVEQYLRKLHNDPKITGIVHYKYKGTPARKTHVLKYVTRSTFRIFNKEKAEMLKGYRSTAQWGYFPPDQRPKNFTVAGETGVCMHCLRNTGELVKIQWGEKLKGHEFFRIVNAYTHRGNGYYTGFIRDGMVSPL